MYKMEAHEDIHDRTNDDMWDPGVLFRDYTPDTHRALLLLTRFAAGMHVGLKHD